jgi:hypothetical protein
VLNVLSCPGAGGVVSRPGLCGRLGASAPVTVVSAPPGSGKTILLRSWVGQPGLAESAAWVPVGRYERGAGERLLGFRAGTLNRRAEWVSPAGRRVRVCSVRLVSFAQRAVAAVCHEVEPLDGRARIAVQSELLAKS